MIRAGVLFAGFCAACFAQTIAVPVAIERFSRTYPADCVIEGAARNPTAALAFHPGGKLLASGGYGEVLLWDIEHARLARRIDVSSDGMNVRALAFAPDGTLAVAAGTPGRTGAILFGTTSIYRDKDEILSLAFSPDGKWLAAGGSDGLVRVWDTGTKQLAATITAHTEAATAVAFSPDGKYFATGSGDKTVRIWKASTWDPVVVLPSALTEPVTSVAFSTDSQLLAFAVSGETESAVRIWRTATAAAPSSDDARAAVRRAVAMKQTRPFDTGAGAPLSVAWSKPRQMRMARPRVFVGCSDGNVKILAQNGRVAAELAGHTDWVHVVATSGDLAASAGSDGAVKLWSALDGRLLASLVQVAPRKDEWVIVTPRGQYTASSSKWIQWKQAAGAVPEELLRGLDNVSAVRTALGARPAFRRGAR